MGSKTKKKQRLRINPMSWADSICPDLFDLFWWKKNGLRHNLPGKMSAERGGRPQRGKTPGFLLKKSGSIASKYLKWNQNTFHSLFSSNIRKRWAKKRTDHDKSIKAAKEKGVKSDWFVPPPSPWANKIKVVSWRFLLFHVAKEKRERKKGKSDWNSEEMMLIYWSL